MLKVWKKSEAEKADKDTVFLRLIQSGNDVDLCIVDTQGKKIPGGYVLTLDADINVIVLHSDVNSALEMKRDLCDALQVYPAWQLDKLSIKRKTPASIPSFAEFLEMIQKKRD